MCRSNFGCDSGKYLEKLEKDRKLFATFVNLENAYEEVMGYLENIGVGRHLLEGIRHFFKDTSASVQVNWELRESYGVFLKV